MLSYSTTNFSTFRWTYKSTFYNSNFTTVKRSLITADLIPIVISILKAIVKTFNTAFISAHRRSYISAVCATN